jgi:hypothetical protein
LEFLTGRGLGVSANSAKLRLVLVSHSPVSVVVFSGGWSALNDAMMFVGERNVRREKRDLKKIVCLENI